MKILLYAAASCVHTVQWANQLAKAGLDITVASQYSPIEELHPKVSLLTLPIRNKCGYIGNRNRLVRSLQFGDWDLFHIHNATGHGTMARLIRFSPSLLSVYGSDVYDVPRRSRLHHSWVRGNLLAANRIASTSHCMAEQVKQIVPELRNIAITPFGVDVRAFKDEARYVADRTYKNPIVIGTVKTLKKKYGVDILVKAFAKLKIDLEKESPGLASKLVLRIVGDGPERGALESLARKQGVSDVTCFAGRVSHAAIPRELGSLDVYAALSRLDSESFGVAVVEASACEVPVVVSDAGGLPEVVCNGETGYVVPREDSEAAMRALKVLVLNPGIRKMMGTKGASFVRRNYDWSNCIARMVEVYEETIKSNEQKTKNSKM